MLLKDVLAQGVNILNSSGNETPVFEAGVILCHVLKCQKVFLYSHDDYQLNEREYREYIEAVSKRTNGMPLQYITGHQEFMSLDFKVTSDVLIPRQDTEILVETVLEYTKPIKEETIDILDIGTGSGCIAVSLARYIKKSKVVAIDISQKALNIAKYNAEKNNVIDKMNFVCGDIFTGLENILNKYNEYKNNKKKFDVIVSNPPYIPSDEIASLEKQVKDFEPLKALNGGNDGLDFYKFIIEDAACFLKKQGALALEVGINQAIDVLKLMQEKYHNIKIVKDLSGIERVVMGELNY
ncbi:MAG TPA: peptide chain release factor N(5)-glutamine methyltransferase [Clostridium sp.]|jgi:release factor glutamine methyltransferase|nr:peptide chain release factor N(5)-glutamine methyltransferase [Clostridium sp.]